MIDYRINVLGFSAKDKLLESDNTGSVESDTTELNVVSDEAVKAWIAEHQTTKNKKTYILTSDINEIEDPLLRKHVLDIVKAWKPDNHLDNQRGYVKPTESTAAAVDADAWIDEHLITKSKKSYILASEINEIDDKQLFDLVKTVVDNWKYDTGLYTRDSSKRGQRGYVKP